jgi:hypothetical protein
MCLKKLCENVFVGCNAQNYDLVEPLKWCNTHNCDLVEPLEGCLSWNRIHVEVNTLNLSYKWRNYMVMNQVSKVIIIACCCEYTGDKNKELHV